MQVLQSPRIGKTAELLVGSNAAVFDAAGDKILLTRRSDNGRWCLPGGRTDPGESLTETCERELWEETGLRATVQRLVGIYSDPNSVVRYADGSTWQVIAAVFEVKVVQGEAWLKSEVTELGWFTNDEALALDLVELYPQRIADAFAKSAVPFIR